MKISFRKIDRLLWLMDESLGMIEAALFDCATELKNSDKVELQALYKELIDITASDKPEDVKAAERVEAINKIADIDEDLHHYLLYFDEESMIRYLTVAHYQLMPHGAIKDKYGICSDIELANAHVRIYPHDVQFKDTIIEIIERQEPTFEDVEKEFWDNCPDVNQVNALCNIYRERCKGELLEDDDFTRYYGLWRDEDEYDNENENDSEYKYVQYFKDLRLCGLIQVEKCQAERKVKCIASSLETLRNDITQFFENLRASCIPSTIDEPEASANAKGAARIRIAALKEILKKAGLQEQYLDNTKINKLVAYLTGSGEAYIRKISSPRIEFTDKNKREIDEVNKYLSDVGIDIKIDIHTNY